MKTIATLGGHSALDICLGAKKAGFKTLVVCQKGREKTYSEYYKTNGEIGCVDSVIVLDKFSDLTNPDVIKKLKAEDCVFIQSRYFWVYMDFNKIEKEFPIPIFGTRKLLRFEERAGDMNQYRLLDEAKIRAPKSYSNPKEIDRLVMVKASEKSRKYERGFFLVSSYKEYLMKSKELIAKNIISKDSLENARIEEFCLGPQVNFNFFYSPIKDRLELMGCDTRRQTNISGFLNLTADKQLDILKTNSPSYVENGHMAITVKESLIEKALEMGKRFVLATKKLSSPGIIGPFALQGVYVSENGKEEFVVFDVSVRMPGSPGIIATPYASYLHRNPLSIGDRIAMELKSAIKEKRLDEVLT